MALSMDEGWFGSDFVGIQGFFDGDRKAFAVQIVVRIWTLSSVVLF